MQVSRAHAISKGNQAYHMFLHSVIFIDWMYCDRRGPENRGCLSVCLCVCLCVCLFVCEESFAETTGPISTKLTQIGPTIV